MTVQLDEGSLISHLVTLVEGVHVHTRIHRLQPSGKGGRWSYGLIHWPLVPPPSVSVFFVSRCCSTCHRARSISNSISG